VVPGSGSDDQAVLEMTAGKVWGVGIVVVAGDASAHVGRMSLLKTTCSSRMDMVGRGRAEVVSLGGDGRLIHLAAGECRKSVLSFQTLCLQT